MITTRPVPRRPASACFGSERSSTMAVIQATHLGKRYPNGAAALVDLSLTVEPGELVAVLGPSGSGKTTLFRLCNGAVRPSSGDLNVLGVPMHRSRGRQLRRLRRRIAVVPQSYN